MFSDVAVLWCTFCSLYCIDKGKSNQERWVNIANICADLFGGEWFYRKLSLINGDLQ